jgi:hypothetical protein
LEKLMTIKRASLWISMAATLAACESGDINLQPTNIDNSTGGGGGGGGANPCASYASAGTTRQGQFDGTNCTYDATFVSGSNPLTLDVRIPFISGVHIFQDALEVGTNVSSGAAPASGTGPKLIIDAGSKIAFTASNDYLRINRGSQILADGTPAAPITISGFTDLVTRTAGPLDVQLWGGLVLNGNGITNNCTDAQRASNACHVTSEGQPSHYGGNDNADNSGILRYVVLKHTGFEVAPGDELNGITFNAVGSGTVVENVQVYSGYDDGVEFFGGAVNVTNLVAMYIRDDSIDFSDGYVGTVKNALVIHPPQNGNRCIEGDNIAETRLTAGAGGANTPPITKPTVSHMTCLTSNFDVGTHGDSEGPIIRFGARMIITDSIIEAGRGTRSSATGSQPSNECWEIETASNPDTAAAAAAGESTMNRTVIACQEPTSDNLPNGDTGPQWVLNNGGGTATFNTNNAIITDPANAVVRVLEPMTFFSFDSDAAATTVTIVNAAGANVVLQVPDGYIGAVRRSADWTANWTYGIAANNRGLDPWWEN